MTQTITHLSNNGISLITKSNPDQQTIYVQVVDIQTKKGKNYIYLSDGNYMVKALPMHQDVLDPAKDINCVIGIKECMMAKNKVVGIMQFQKVFNYKSRIGNPVDYNTEAINPQNSEACKLQKSMIQMQLNQTPVKPQVTVKMQQPTMKKQLPQTANKSLASTQPQKPPVSNPLNGNLKDYEIIKNLYVGMDRWTIVCRIVKLEYNEFVSKKTQKDTKVLNIELMDRTGMKIAGVFFGDAAVKFKDYLVKDRVYKISQGQIRAQNYNNSKNQKMSSNKINFTSLSEFEQVSDTNSISKNEDSAITLGQCVDRKVLNQEFDVICILVNIEDTVQVKKNERPLKKTNLLVADPVKNITMYAVVWGETLIPDRSLIGKSIILGRFILKEYKESFNLSSVIRSSIIPVENHAYQKLEQQAMSSYHSYQKLHQIRTTSNQGDRQVCHSLKELQQKLNEIGNEEWVRAQVTVCVNKFGLKKWHYEGCPFCGKAAERLGNCPNGNCNKYVENTKGHFIMPVEVSDATGSLWTTAYDEWAKKIFNLVDQQPFIQQLKSLQQNQLKQATESYLYQQYRMRINSKKDNEGRIKHHMSKIFDRNLSEEIMNNVQLINALYIS